MDFFINGSQFFLYSLVYPLTLQIPEYRVSIHPGFVFSFYPADIAVVTIVTNHLLTFVRDVGAHGCQPLQGIKDILLFSVFGPVKQKRNQAEHLQDAEGCLVTL